jgi:hypothetical protein
VLTNVKSEELKNKKKNAGIELFHEDRKFENNGQPGLNRPCKDQNNCVIL